MGKRKSGEMGTSENLNDKSEDNVEQRKIVDKNMFWETVSGVQAQKAGMQKKWLQDFIASYSRVMNDAAIAKSTGLPVRTPVASYKGFAAEEFLKYTQKLNALANGVPHYSIGVYTGKEPQPMPDGTWLSGIDMETDIAIWLRRRIWHKPVRMRDYQVKMFKDERKYLAAEEKYGVPVVGAKGIVENNKVGCSHNGKEITSDSITNEAAEELARNMKEQSTPDYPYGKEKHRELDRINSKKAITSGAISGALFSTIKEICDIIKEDKEPNKDRFVQSIRKILCDTVDGGVRGGAIMNSVPLMSKVLKRQILPNSLGAVPVQALADTAVSFAEDLYKCFITGTIDADDLLCNTVNKAFSSGASYGGTYVGGKVGGLLATAKSTAETGAAIGSVMGPIGTVIGAVVSGLVIGVGVNAIIGTAEKDALDKYEKCVHDIISYIEEKEECEKVFYYVDSISNLSDSKLSFRYLLPCYNLISDLKEYNLRKKDLKEINNQLETKIELLGRKRKNELENIKQVQEERISELHCRFIEEKEKVYQKYRSNVDAYAMNSYYQFLSLYDVMSGNTKNMLNDLETETTKHNEILVCMRNRNTFHRELNLLLEDLSSDKKDEEQFEILVKKIRRCMEQDELIVGKQYISFEEVFELFKESYDRDNE